MGFSNYLRSLLGREADIVKPLLAFNIGLEIGQLVIVSLILVLAFMLIDIAEQPLTLDTHRIGHCCGHGVIADYQQ